jgi:hypothetical protein
VQQVQNLQLQPMQNKFVGRPIYASDVLELLESLPLLQCTVDFSKPDGLRTRALTVENKKIYICEYYMSVWSPVFRSIFFNQDGLDQLGKDSGKQTTLAIPNAKYGNILDLLECMYPQEKSVSGEFFQFFLDFEC